MTKFDDSAADKIRRMYRSWSRQGGKLPPSTNDLSYYIYSFGPIGLLLEDIPGFEINEEGITDESFEGFWAGAARIWLPKVDETGLSLEEATSGKAILVYNMTPFDLQANEEVYLNQQSGGWLITAPVLPITAYCILSEDLFPDDEAEAEFAWGTDVVLAAPESIPEGEMIAEGQAGFCVRGKEGYYLMTSNACPVPQGE